MRTRSEMLTKIRRHISDVNSSKFTNDTDLATIMSQASDHFWNLCMRDSRAMKLLDVTQAPMTLLANWDEYPFPSDVLRIQELEYREYSTLYATLTCDTAGETDYNNWASITDGAFRIRLEHRAYDVSSIDFTGVSDMDDVASTIQTALRAVTGGSETVTYDSDDDYFQFSSFDRCGYLESHPYQGVSGFTSTDISGSSYLNGQRGSATPAVTSGAPDWVIVPYGPNRPAVLHGSYTLATNSTYGSQPSGWLAIDEDYAKVYPLLNGVNGIIRFRYYRKPTFPTEDYERFLDLPDGVDTLIEYMTAVLTSLEKIEDDGAILQMNVFGDTFKGMWEEFLNGIGGSVVREPREIQVVEN